MIDLHSHVLPGIDDGPETMDDAVAMLRRAQDEELHTLVATPHVMKGSYDNSRADIIAGVAALNRAAQAAGLEIKVAPGGEVYIDFDILDDIKQGTISTIGDSHYILLEFPTMELPQGMDEIIFELQIKGYYPILAHPERNLSMIEDPALLYEYVYKGVLVQQNTGSLLGEYGKTVQRVARTFLRHNLVHAVGSDAHNTGSRTFNHKRWVTVATPLIGAANVSYLTNVVPQGILRDEEIDFTEPQQITAGTAWTKFKDWWTRNG